MSKYLITGKNILLVEDNRLNRQIETEVLRHYGANVTAVTDGKYALKKINKMGIDYYDIILLDINLPMMTGYEIADAIREIPGGEKGKVKIIGLSGSSIQIDKSKSLDGYCRKPLTVTELVSVL